MWELTARAKHWTWWDRRVPHLVQLLFTQVSNNGVYGRVQGRLDLDVVGEPSAVTPTCHKSRCEARRGVQPCASRGVLRGCVSFRFDSMLETDNHVARRCHAVGATANGSLVAGSDVTVRLDARGEEEEEQGEGAPPAHHRSVPSLSL